MNNRAVAAIRGVAVAAMLLACGAGEPQNGSPGAERGNRALTEWPAVDALEVVPSSASMRVGERLRFVARTDAERSLREAAQWSTSNPGVATVDGRGFVHGVDPGSATIRAQSEGRSASATVRVMRARESAESPAAPESPNAAASPEAAVSSDPSAAETAIATREPTGYATITSRRFGARDDAGWRFNPSADFEIVVDERAPRACCSVARAIYRSGREGGNSPVVTWYDFSSKEYTELFISFWLKLSDNWQGHRSGVNKIGFVWVHGDPTVYFSAQGRGGGPLQPQVRLQDVPGGARNLVPNRGTPVVQRGQWHHWEVQLVSNSRGGRDGTARLWLDGALVADYTDVSFAGADQRKVWESIYWYPIWGGTGDTVRRDMYMDIDHLFVSGR